jgi:hypothetical protein
VLHVSLHAWKACEVRCCQLTTRRPRVLKVSLTCPTFKPTFLFAVLFPTLTSNLLFFSSHPHFFHLLVFHHRGLHPPRAFHLPAMSVLCREEDTPQLKPWLTSVLARNRHLRRCNEQQ